MTNFEKWLQDKDNELFNYYLEGKKFEKEEEDEDEDDKEEEDKEDEEEDHKEKKKKSSMKTDEDGDGKKGTAKDYLIARFKKGGMPHDEAIKKAKEAVAKKKS